MTVRIYNSKGYELRNGGQSQDQDKRIEDFFFAGVRVAIDVTMPQRAEVIVYFRARNSSDGGVSGRANQYFAALEMSANQNTLSREDIRTLAATTVEKVKQRCDELGLSLDTSMEDMEAFRQLSEMSPVDPTDQFEGEVAANIVENNQRPRYGATGERRAIELLTGFLATTDAQSGVIADQVEHSVVSQYDIGLQPDATTDFTPLGDTSTHVQQTKRSMRTQIIKHELSSIEESVSSLRSEADLSPSEIRSRVTSRVPALKQPQTSSGSNAAAFDATSSDDDLLSKLPLKAIGAVVAVVIILAVAIVGASSAGVISGIPPLDGGGSGEPTVSVNASHAGGNNISVEAVVKNAASPVEVTIEAKPTSGTEGKVITEKNNLSDGKYTTTISVSGPGDWNVTVSHGSKGTGTVVSDFAKVNVPKPKTPTQTPTPTTTTTTTTNTTETTTSETSSTETATST